MIVKVCRVYFNRPDDYGKLWSVDFGDGTAEIICANVSSTAPMVTDANLMEQRGEYPKGWFEFRNVNVVIRGSQVSITQCEST